MPLFNCFSERALHLKCKIKITFNIKNLKLATYISKIVQKLKQNKNKYKSGVIFCITIIVMYRTFFLNIQRVLRKKDLKSHHNSIYEIEKKSLNNKEK